MTEKCDVYSFGVVAFEVIKGKHPGDYFANNLALMSSEENIQLKEFVDERLGYPDDPQVENILVSIIKLLRDCLYANPQSRPTMNMVSIHMSSIVTGR